MSEQDTMLPDPGVSDASDETTRRPDGEPARVPAPPPIEAAGRLEPEGLTDPRLYLNRELTWLSFAWRVLAEAADPRTPLLERVKFLSIVCSNLDEFFMKRIGGLKQQVGAGMHQWTVDGRSPERQIRECYQYLRRMLARERKVLAELLALLRGREVVVASYEELDAAQRSKLREHYIENIFPLVTPQAMDPAHPFPFVSNLSLNLLVTLRVHESGEPSHSRVKVPVGAGIPRLLRVGDGHVYVPLEDVMAHNLDLLFPGTRIEGYALFRVTRNAQVEQDEEQADDLLALIETELRERRFAPIVRLEVSAGMDPVHRGMLAAELGLDEADDVFEIDGMMRVRDLMELADLDLPQLRYGPHHPVDHPALLTDRNIFHVIRDCGSLLVHHPYESFGTSVERFLFAASEDPKVRAIKMTLYRTSAQTNVVDYLERAARNGKQVTVVVELKARFDEEANIRWANRLEQAGVHVTYGVVGYKTHCKTVLVVRQDYDGLRRYAHIGTGNYHAGTARLYSDVGLITADPDIGHDLTELFNFLTTGYAPHRDYRKLLPAPSHLKEALLERIEREIRAHTPDDPGLIQLKMNALEDADVTAALYRASQAGIRVDLIVRDTCRLRPGLPGISESARVISIVGRFLEHARIYYFRNGGQDEYLIGSADLMKRNLESRVEVLAPVELPSLKEELRAILDLQLDDHRSAWEMRSDGSYVQRVPSGGRSDMSSQELCILWAEERNREGQELARRKPRGLSRRKPPG